MFIVKNRARSLKSTVVECLGWRKKPHFIDGPMPEDPDAAPHPPQGILESEGDPRYCLLERSQFQSLIDIGKEVAVQLTYVFLWLCLRPLRSYDFVTHLCKVESPIGGRVIVGSHCCD